MFWRMCGLGLLILITMMVLDAVPIAQGEDDTETGTPHYVLCIPGSEVNIRSGPSTDTDGQGWVVCGDEVEVVSTRNRWARCINLERESTVGWVHLGYLVKGIVTVHEEPITMVIESNGRVAARRSVDGKRRKWLKNGDQVRVYAFGGNWACTDQGYIRTGYLGGVE